MKWTIAWEYRQVLYRGLILTLEISSISIVASTFVGMAVAWIGTLPGFLAQRLTSAYVEMLRNVPVVVKVFFLYFAVGLDALPAAVIGLTLHQSAYIADVIASGLRAVPREQHEAAYAAGLRRYQIFAHVLLPQVFRVVMPPMTTQYIEVVKNSAIAMMIGIEELTFQTQQIEAETFRGFEAATIATASYVVIALLIAGSMNMFAGRLKAGST